MTVYHRAALDAHSTPPVPQGQRVPFGWKAFGLATGDSGAVLRWNVPLSDLSEPARLRVTVALDVRENKRVSVYALESGTPLGTFDVRFPSVCQPIEIVLSPDAAMLALREGVRLKQTEGQQPLHLFIGGSDVPGAFAPHFLGDTGGDPWQQFRARLCSGASLQTFGWIAGCVWDGLWQLSQTPNGDDARAACREQVRRFVSESGDLDYENPRSVPQHNRIYGMEGVLPFAILAQIEPDSPALSLVEPAIRAHLDATDAATDGEWITTEGAYIVGYPLAVLAKKQNRPDLAELAFAQLRARQKRNTTHDTIYQSASAAGTALPNWARGVAWYLLGFARVLETLQPGAEAADLYAEFRRAALFVLPYQRPDGLWGNFFGDPDCLPDTSGSAGIAAALATGANQGWLPESAGIAARKTVAGLKAYLTPDGFLGGVAPFNKGGEALQRSDYRILSPMGMGLAAQLRAALRLS